MASAVPPKVPADANGSFPTHGGSGLGGDPIVQGQLGSFVTGSDGSLHTGAKQRTSYDLGAATGDPVAGNGSQAAFELRDSAKGTGYVGPDSGPGHADVGD